MLDVGKPLPGRDRGSLVADVKAAVHAVFWIVCGVIFFGGCSRPKSKFAGEIAGTDTIAFINDWGETNAITKRDEVSKLVRAVSSAKRDKHDYDAVFQSRLRFYRGTNLLGEV